MKASECKCIECGKQAVAFWPVIDPVDLEVPNIEKFIDDFKRAMEE